MVQKPGLRLEFDPRDIKRIDRAFKIAPRVLLSNLDKANRSTALHIQRQAIRNLSTGRLTAVDTGDLKRAVTVAKVEAGVHAVGVPTNIKQGRFMETGTGLFVKNARSKGRLKVTLPTARPRMITAKKSGGFLMIPMDTPGARSRSKRRKKRPAIANNRAFLGKSRSGRPALFTQKVRGSEPRFWLSDAAKDGQRRHTLFVQRAISKTLGEIT